MAIEFANDLLKDYAINAVSEYPESVTPDPNNPKSVVGFDVNGKTIQFKIIEHINPANVSGALSHETVALTAGNDYKIFGDVQGYTFVNDPDCYKDNSAPYRWHCEEFNDHGYSINTLGGGVGHNMSTNTQPMGQFWHLSAQRLGPVRSKNDIIRGNNGNDTLVGLSYADTLYGGQGHDVLFGDDINEAGTASGVLYAGKDVLYGNAGNDTLFGGRGNDSLYGGIDSDFLLGDDGDDLLDGGDGVDELQGGAGNDSLLGENGNDRIFGEAGNDSLYGGLNDDYLHGGEGDNYLNGQDGSDTFVVGSGTNQIWGGENNTTTADFDVVDYSEQAAMTLVYSNTTINGQTSLQVIKQNGAVDTLHYIDKVIVSNAGAGIAGNGNANEIFGGAGTDTIQGSGGNDTIYGYEGANQIDGGADNDLIYGGADAGESIWGGAGDDTIQGNGGNDFIYGGDGNDYIVCGSGMGLAEGGTGADTIASLDGDDVTIYINSQTGVIFELTEEKSTEGLFVGRGYGSADNPNLESAGDLTIGFRAIEGSLFADSIYGNSQDNVLAGNSGNDTLCGNAGSDNIQGGTGDDYFVFGNGSGYDYIFEGADEGQQDVGFFVGITSINIYKMWDHLMLAANGDADVMVLDKWYTSGGVELIYFADVDVAYSAADLAAMAFDITPAATFSGEGSEEQPNTVIPVGISSADASNYFDATQLSA